MTKNNLRWAIVGLGKHAKVLADAMKSARQELVAVVGREQHAKPFLTGPVKRFDSLSDALEGAEFDAVCIASPNFRHAGEATESLRAEKHVLLEKPMALSMEEARSIEAAAKKSGTICMIDFHLRQHPTVRRAKEILESGALGEVISIDMRWSVGSPGGVLPELPEAMQWRDDPKLAGGGAIMARGVHLFDLLRFLSGSEVVEVCAQSDATEHTVDRTIVGLFRLKNGTIATVQTSKKLVGARNGVEVAGTKGSIWLDIFGSGNGTLCITDADGAKEELFPPHDLYASVFEAFTLSLEGGANFGATLGDGLASVAITDAFQKSVQTRGASRPSDFFDTTQ